MTAADTTLTPEAQARADVIALVSVGEYQAAADGLWHHLRREVDRSRERYDRWVAGEEFRQHINPAFALSDAEDEFTRFHADYLTADLQANRTAAVEALMRRWSE